MNIKSTLRLFLIFTPFAIACSTAGKIGHLKSPDFYKRIIQNAEQKADAYSIVTPTSLTSTQLINGAAVFMNTRKSTDKTVVMAIQAHQLTPGQLHAVHLHEIGSCDNGAEAAGGHWNPTHEQHGQRGDGLSFHAGDIINLEADQNGDAFWYGEIKGWSISSDPTTGILGKTVIIHVGQDDFHTQPAGAAGKRGACGIIQKRK